MRIRQGTGLAAATALGLFPMTGAHPDVSMTSTLMKVDPGLIPGAARLLEPGETGVGFTAVQESGIRQMDNLNADYIVLLQDRGEGLELRSLRKDAL